MGVLPISVGALPMTMGVLPMALGVLPMSLGVLLMSLEVLRIALGALPMTLAILTMALAILPMTSGVVPTYGKTSNIREVFPCMGRHPIYEKILGMVVCVRCGSDLRMLTKIPKTRAVT
jgi:hypothetical protein